MGAARAIDRSYAGVTKRLADAHRKRDKGIVAVWSFPDPDEREVRLVEVTKSVPFREAIVPFSFAPKEDMPFESVVILAHPDDWVRIEARKLKLPRGWKIETKKLA
jgi:hypothetical protein